MAQQLEDWMNRKWRPAMGWMYFVVCITDFIIFPVMWTAFHSGAGLGIQPWDPLTLKGGGLFHVAMGAVLGIAVWSRGQEKLHGVAGEPLEVNKNSAAGPVQPVAAKNAKITRPSQPPEPVI